jgi:hypothetical protein
MVNSVITIADISNVLANFNKAISRAQRFDVDLNVKKARNETITVNEQDLNFIYDIHELKSVPLLMPFEMVSII